MSENDNDTPGAARGFARQPEKPLPKRFYKAVGVEARDGAHVLLLDGRTARTPGQKALLALPGMALARAVAAEWEAQGETINPMTMPLTRLANTALDGVAGRESLVRADIVQFAGSDLLCYRAGHPQELVERQGALWDPVLAWAADELGARFVLAEGVMPVTQSPAALAAIDAALARAGAFTLAPLHVMTTLMGSSLLAIAHWRGRLTAEAAWIAAHADEDFQIARWGEDEEAASRREKRRAEMQAAARMLALVG